MNQDVTGEAREEEREGAWIERALPWMRDLDDSKMPACLEESREMMLEREGGTAPVNSSGRHFLIYLSEIYAG